MEFSASRRPYIRPAQDDSCQVVLSGFFLIEIVYLECCNLALFLPGLVDAGIDSRRLIIVVTRQILFCFNTSKPLAFS